MLHIESAGSFQPPEGYVSHSIVDVLSVYTLQGVVGCLQPLCPEALVNATLPDRLVQCTSSIFITFFYEMEISIMGM